jgi:hypothetical protein
MIIRNHKTEPLKLSPEQIAGLRDAKQSAKSPSILSKAKHAAQAGGRIIKAAAKGEQVRISDQGRDERLSICRACDLWNEGGNVGLGECTHSKCGCTRFKHGLATETCPLGKWPQTNLDNSTSIHYLNTNGTHDLHQYRQRQH